MAYDSQLLDQLKRFMQDQHSSATYACGGSVPMDQAEAADSNNSKRVLTRPVTLRWDRSPDASTDGNPAPWKLTLGPAARDDGALEQLMQDCQTAGFGLHGKDVVDETYRKARKMGAAQFCTDFNPYEVGICDAIAQVLMPSVAGADKVRGVRAELYSINIYSAPSGKFNAHVDTPRSSSQFGSLVVCLPSPHDGGQLLVKHAGQTMEFDWSENATAGTSSAVRWAAFYSDCEHEVREVTKGHRVTLTYNLYFAQESGLLSGVGAINPASLPLYGYFNALLKDSQFMTKGGVLGIPCAHAYPHTNENDLHCLPEALKGMDMAAYEAMRALGLNIRLRPILEDRNGDLVEMLSENQDQNQGEETNEGGNEDDEKDASDDMRNQPQDDGEASLSALTIVGTQMHQLRFGDMVDDDDLHTRMLQDLWQYKLEEVRWIGDVGTHRQSALAYIVYGNEAEMDTHYSFAALLVQVPPASVRTQLTQPT